jgi:hypothetical protein
MTIFRRRSSSPRDAKYARKSIRPVSSPCDPAGLERDRVEAGDLAQDLLQRHSSSSAPCAASVLDERVQVAEAGSAASRSLTRGLYFIVQEPSG